MTSPRLRGASIAGVGWCAGRAASAGPAGAYRPNGRAETLLLLLAVLAPPRGRVCWTARRGLVPRARWRGRGAGPQYPNRLRFTSADVSWAQSHLGRFERERRPTRGDRSGDARADVRYCRPRLDRCRTRAQRVLIASASSPRPGPTLDEPTHPRVANPRLSRVVRRSPTRSRRRGAARPDLARRFATDAVRLLWGRWSRPADRPRLPPRRSATCRVTVSIRDPRSRTRRRRFLQAVTHPSRSDGVWRLGTGDPTYMTLMRSGGCRYVLRAVRVSGAGEARRRKPGHRGGRDIAGRGFVDDRPSRTACRPRARVPSGGAQVGPDNHYMTSPQTIATLRAGLAVATSPSPRDARVGPNRVRAAICATAIASLAGALQREGPSRPRRRARRVGIASTSAATCGSAGSCTCGRPRISA